MQMAMTSLLSTSIGLGMLPIWYVNQLITVCELTLSPVIKYII